ncbi:sigma-70 family RNA polymerase sigma factor [Actinoplanes missouriensis]|uniref:sigma-70 family RNA polymerase sigma factor n=1 Tax=Actinoplanes missouriensis TaxID=1866 RepID=UPI0033DEE6C8
MEQLYVEYRPALLAYLAGFTTGSGQSAEDLLQETMIRVWRRLDALPGDPEAARRWLFTVARNTGIDAVRRAHARPVGVELPDTLPAPGRDESAETVVALDSMRSAVRGLSSAHRRILTELYLEGRSASETARKLGVPVGTVKSRAHYALRSLRQAMLRPVWQ